jgi:phospholipid transport system substrate-binding protein
MDTTCRIFNAARLATVLIVLGFAAGPAMAADAPAGAPRPIEIVRASVARVQAIMLSQPGGVTEAGQLEIRHVAANLFAFDEMSRRTLARHWTEGSPSQQAEFIRLFTNVLERFYLNVIGNFATAQVVFESEAVEGPYARVRSRIAASERHPEIVVEYRLLKTDERWTAYDVVYEGASLVSNYRTQLNTIMRTSSFAQLLDRMRGNEIEARVIRRQVQGR